jgi:transposase-like protein
MAKRGKLALTAEVSKTLLENYAETGSLELAAAEAGIARKTVYNWIRQAERDGDNSPQAGFVVSLRKARAKYVRKLYAKVKGAADKHDVNAAKWMIERLEAKPDVQQEAWGVLTDEEAIEEVARDPRMIAAVLRQQAALQQTKALPSGDE